MKSRHYFGTDGVRGPFGGPVVNEAFAERLGFAVAVWSGKKGRALIGRDTRASGRILEAAVARGLRAGGVEPVSVGIAPTPAVARAVRIDQAALGVVITASHNPAPDNGLKFFGPGGVKLTDAEESAVEQLLPETPSLAPAVMSTGDVAAAYIAAATKLLPANALAGWRIVLDTANGASCGTSPVVLRALGAEVIGIGDAPDGQNINAGVGSEHPKLLAARVKATGARVGVAHDGDGDRCVLCDEQGSVLDGDEILTLLATHALALGTLVNRTLVVTVQSNLGVDAAIKAAGGRVHRTAVGDRYVSEGMLAEHATLGGESSGHIICSDVSPTGDGLVAALKVIEVMLATKQPLSVLRRSLEKVPQLTAALTVREKRPLESLPALATACRAIEEELGSQGRVMVRYSGTERKLRLLVEGPTTVSVQVAMAQLEAAARADLDVLP